MQVNVGSALIIVVCFADRSLEDAGHLFTAALAAGNHAFPASHITAVVAPFNVNTAADCTYKLTVHCSCQESCKPVILGITKLNTKDPYKCLSSKLVEADTCQLKACWASRGHLVDARTHTQPCCRSSLCLRAGHRTGQDLAAAGSFRYLLHHKQAPLALAPNSSLNDPRAAVQQNCPMGPLDTHFAASLATRFRLGHQQIY